MSDRATLVRISVCTPTYQGRERLEVTAPRILSAMGGDDEWIVAVDGSTDGTAEYLEGLSEVDPRVRVLARTQNRGRTATLNEACRAARGQIVLRLDDDILVKFDFLELHAAAHDAHQEPIGVVQPLVDLIDPTRGSRMWRAFVERNSKSDLERFTRNEDDVPASLWGPVCSCRRSSGEALGWYDETFDAYGWEDVEFGYRLRQDGARIVLLRDAAVEHMVHWTSFARKFSRGFEAGARMAVFARIHGPSAVLVALGQDGAARVVPSTPLARSVSTIRGPHLRGLLSVVARLGERLLALVGWRRAYDGWVARWLTWSYASGWLDECRGAGLPQIEQPTQWRVGTSASSHEMWGELCARVAAMGSDFRVVAALRSAYLRSAERGRVSRAVAWRHAAGARRRLARFARSAGVPAASTDSDCVVLFFEAATPSSVDGLICVADELGADGRDVRLLSAAPFVSDYVEGRHGRRPVPIDDALAPLADSPARLTSARSSAREAVAELERALGGDVWTSAARGQLEAEVALADLVAQKARATATLKSAQCIVAASEYFAPSVALRAIATDSSVPWVTLQHGAVNVMYAPFSADLYLAWSEEAARALEALEASAASAVRVAGSPERRVTTGPSRAEELRDVLGIRDGEPVVMVFSQTHGPEFSMATHFAFAAQLRLLLDADPTVVVLIKRHPSEPRSAYESLSAVHPRCRVVPNGFSSADAASVAQVAVAVGSTALIDSTAADCAAVEVLTQESLLAQAVSDLQVELDAVCAQTLRLVQDGDYWRATVDRQHAGRDRFVGPPDFGTRVVAELDRLLESSGHG